MRLAALIAGTDRIVMTHDSIGLGETGPTAPSRSKHLAISRAKPNTYVFRPAITFETAEAWEIAVEQQEKHRPCCL